MITGQTTLAEAYDELAKHFDEGTHCYLCTQRVQVYWRSLNSEMARAMIALHRFNLAHPGEFAHMPTLLRRKQADEAKLRYWGLAEEDDRVRDDGSNRAGFWRITPLGTQWVLGQVKLPRYVRVFDSRALGAPSVFSRTGKQYPLMGIRDALGNKFDYGKLMDGES